MSLDPQRRRDLERTGRRLEYATTVWNSSEAFIAISTGLAAHSIALVAFGLDSCIEVFASIVVLWFLGGEREDVAPERARRAMRLIAIAFIALGIYLVIDVAHGLATKSEPGTSALGTVFMAATVVVMFVLAWGKRRTGLALANRPLIANASMTFIDGLLASGICLALILDALVGWWWADPVAAGLVAVVALNEGREAWKG